MNVIDKIKHIIDTNDITDEDILELRTYFSSIFTSDESQAWEEANEMAHDQFLQEQMMNEAEEWFLQQAFDGMKADEEAQDYDVFNKNKI